MNTQHKKLLSLNENKKYYAKSDGQFMAPELSLVAHKVLDRVRWVREWVHTLDSQLHLDVGCKDGYTCLTLAAEGVDCIGIDPSEDAIAEAKRKAALAGYAVDYRVSFLENLKSDDTYETVSCMEVLEHVVDVDKFMTKLSELGLYVMLTTPDAYASFGLMDVDRNEEHVRLFTKKELIELVEKYGEIDEILQRDDALYCIYKPFATWQRR